MTITMTITIAAAAVTAPVSASAGTPLPDDLILTTVHDGPFEAGGAGTFSIDVTAGPASAGIVYPTEVTYYFPAALTPVRASGAGWRCRITARSVGCDTRGLAAPGFQLPRITVGVRVARDASGTLTASGRAVRSSVVPGALPRADAWANTGAGTGGWADAGTGTGAWEGAWSGTATSTVASTVQIVPASRGAA